MTAWQNHRVCDSFLQADSTGALLSIKCRAIWHRNTHTLFPFIDPYLQLSANWFMLFPMLYLTLFAVVVYNTYNAKYVYIYIRKLRIIFMKRADQYTTTLPAIIHQSTSRATFLRRTYATIITTNTTTIHQYIIGIIPII